MYTVSSCDLFDLDINKNPNSPAQASLSLLLTNVELNSSTTFAGGLNDATMGFMAQTTSVDDFNMTTSSWNGTWNYLYSNPLKDLQSMIDVTAKQRADGAANPHYEGIAKTLKAYYFSLMVDLWSDVPYTEAFGGDAATQILAPAFDSDQAIYTACLTLLDEAIAHFGETSPVPVAGDLIYNGSAAQWRAAAKSIKLKLLLQVSREPSMAANAKTQIDALMAAGGFINGIPTGAGALPDFQFTFGALPSPDNRHPQYSAGYAGGDAAYTYFGHQFMYEMLKKSDPRRPFYFKRQTKILLDPSDATQKQTIPCSQRTDCKYGYFPLSTFVTQGLYNKDPEDLSTTQKEFLAGFFGRDRSDPSGVPNDNPIRTTVGVYPAGGLYDDVAEPGGGNQGRGSGIFPMVTSWMNKLHQVEAMLFLNSPAPPGFADAKALFAAALTEQITKVSALGVALDNQSVAITAANRDAYVNARLAEYDLAATNDDKLKLVLKEAWFMNYGNGFETYNTFRRTGYPNDLQIPLQRPRQFALRLPYALDEVNLNDNTPTAVYDSPADAVFWDVLKFQF